MKKLFLLLAIISFNSFAQFDSLIFYKWMRLNFDYTNIYALGDQNGDGFDDIMLFDCSDKRGYIFLGADQWIQL